MNDYLKEKKAQQRREYYRKWRAEHPESVRASQMRYWTKKAEESNRSAVTPEEVETRSMEGC